MVFQTTQISSRCIGIIDIGSYKIRVAICELKNCDIKLLWYAHKRQDKNNINNGEIIHIEWVCQDIRIALAKAEAKAGRKVDDIIISPPFNEVYFSAKKINFVRTYPQRDIDIKELNEIIRTTQHKAINIYMKYIESHIAYKQEQLKLISSHIGSVKSDGILVENLIGQQSSNITLCFSNAFIPKQKSDILNYIGHAVEKNIIKIMPWETALVHLFHNISDLVIVDIGNTHTSIIIKQAGQTLGCEKISIGIADLIKTIEQTSNYTHTHIIDHISDDEFKQMQDDFLAIFLPTLSLAIQEIIGDHICPSDFFLLWGWANGFIETALLSDQIYIHNIKVAHRVNIIQAQESYFWEKYSKDMINIFAMMWATQDAFTHMKSPLRIALKKANQDIM